MLLEITGLSKSCATVSADVWPLAQMHFIHVALQMTTSSEELSTGDALERLLLEMDSLVVILHVGFSAEDLAARGVCARDLLLTHVCRAVVLSHIEQGRK